MLCARSCDIDPLPEDFVLPDISGLTE